jgi:hypothetical protein
VAASEKDTTLQGDDVDMNGVRDDVDGYIETLEADATKVAALKAFAREQTQIMLLSAVKSPTQAAAIGQQVRVVKAIDCLAASYARDRRQPLIRSIDDALLNNGMRWRAYLAVDKLLSGTVLPSPGNGCDLAILRIDSGPRYTRQPMTARRTSASSRFAQSPSPPCPDQGTVFYFGNGINKTAVEADAVVRDDLPDLADEAGVAGPLMFAPAYNQTDGLLSDIVQTLEQKAAEDSRFTWFVMNNVVGYLLRGLNVPTGILDGLPGGSAFVAQLQTLINQLIADSNNQSSAFYDMDVGQHAASYASDLRAGHRVIVIAHSQGNLYANAARARLRSLAPSRVASFGIDAVATPAETSFDGYVTSDSDLVIGLLRQLGRTVLPSNIHVTPTLEDFLGHGFEEIYINAQLSARAAVVSLLSNIADRLPFPAHTCADEPAAGEPSLIGVDVQYEGHCCDSPPSDANLVGDKRYSTVGYRVEFPDLSGVRGNLHIIPADIDIHGSAIEITYNQSATSAPGSFNGYVLTFSGGAVPQILSAAFGSTSTVNLSSANVSIEGNTVLINVPNITFQVGSRISVLLTLF